MFQKLSNELHVLIFGHLPRLDILSVRLVSKLFRANSGQFFRPPRAVISTRLDSLQRLARLINYATRNNQRVEELVWDVSEYKENIAGDFEEYLQACFSAGRRFVNSSLVHKDTQYRAFANALGVQVNSPNWHTENFDDMDTDEVEGYPLELCLAGAMHAGFKNYH